MSAARPDDPRLGLGGLQPQVEAKGAKVLRVLKEALIPEPLPQQRRP